MIHFREVQKFYKFEYKIILAKFYDERVTGLFFATHNDMPQRLDNMFNIWYVGLIFNVLQYII